MGFFSLGRPEAGALLRNGTSQRGHITGIRVTYTRDSPPRRIDEFAIAVMAPAGMQIYGIRQCLRPDEPVRLGLQVILKVNGKAAIIDWVGTCGLLGVTGENVLAGWKPLKEAPYEGVVDESLELDKAHRKGEPARAAITKVDKNELGTDLHLSVRVDGQPPHDTVLHGVDVPFYARHLCEQGSELPAFLRGDRVDLDWPTASRTFMAIEAARRG